MMVTLLARHVLAAMFWAGRMAFAYMVLRLAPFASVYVPKEPLSDPNSKRLPARRHCRSNQLCHLVARRIVAV
jgi:hypothetical protein